MLSNFLSNFRCFYIADLLPYPDCLGLLRNLHADHREDFTATHKFERYLHFGKGYIYEILC